MAPAIAILVVLVLPLLALATYTPRPFAAAVVLLALFAGAVTGIVARDAFLAACAFMLLSSGAFTAGTIAESARILAPRRRRARRRRRRPAAVGAGPEHEAPYALAAHLRDAA